MANIFPSLSPTVRVYSTGNFVVADTFAANGSYNAFRRGSRQVKQTLEMEFAYLTEENMNLIKAHYLERKGTFDFFLASSALWGDYSDDPPVELLGNTAWRFASPPAVTDTSYDRFNVSVALESHAILQGDILSESAGSDPATSFDYIYDALTSSATPARQYTIDPGAS
mgnify:CR=1 FL=1|tara:strand:- start:1667 stop:2173 length:507 start_codon:yes stop_codon:yes gene_type:complete